jgi:Dienelactone hydrolase and related enzymes
MNRLFHPIERRYVRWLENWENSLCFRDTNRIVRPFEYGLEWAKGWPCAEGLPLDESKPVETIRELNQRAIRNSEQFFAYTPPMDFNLAMGSGGPRAKYASSLHEASLGGNGNGNGRDVSQASNWLTFTSPVQTPFHENNRVRAMWFPSPNGKGRAVVLLPHWNSKLPQHNALCSGLARLGVSVLRLSLPYHDERMPEELNRADYAVSSNICRTIDATRQAVIDIRCCFDWLEQQGFTRLGIVGTSLGSCYAFLASAHDARIRVNAFNHCSTYVADVVWRGLSTRHIAESLEQQTDLETLREMWRCISPPSYNALFAAYPKKSKFMYTRFDTTFPVDLSEQVIANANAYHWPHQVKVLPCGHYTMGEFPFKYLAGYEICSFVLKNL